MNYSNDSQMYNTNTRNITSTNQYHINSMYNNPNHIPYGNENINQQHFIPTSNYYPYPSSSPNNPPPIVINQLNPPEWEIQNLRCALRSSSQFISCPYCKNQGLTRTEKQCSCPNLMCCICFGGVFWLLFQACKGKDINCYDASHYCIRCNANLSNYQAC